MRGALWGPLFGQIALIPAALLVSMPVAGVSVPICTGSGGIRTLPLPVKPAPETPCCAKGCHVGGSRKRRI